MQIRVYTSPAEARKKRRESCVELPESSTVIHALAAYAEQYHAPYDISDMRRIIILRNKTIAWFGDVLEDGDELTLLRINTGG